MPRAIVFSPWRLAKSALAGLISAALEARAAYSYGSYTIIVSTNGVEGSGIKVLIAYRTLAAMVVHSHKTSLYPGYRPRQP
jgi:hypothetical protein